MHLTFVPTFLLAHDAPLKTVVRGSFAACIPQDSSSPSALPPFLSPAAFPTPSLRSAAATESSSSIRTATSRSVVSFSDMHFGEGEDVTWGPQQDVNNSIAHAAILEHEKPNYVVFNGDLITGENDVFAFNANKYLDQVFAPTVARKIPFSSTHGNHDNTVQAGPRHASRTGSVLGLDTDSVAEASAA
ncbi:hypothetical protein GGX14DRAFT_652261 [Mycena pura]|uniref:Calcineurin-like phosphoesterase domain-containing protein n=1 Tax=Mycena pura TaxID=153505 RepID=A0AAD6V5V5_9AGAR|nr:hypothetical protein GGX14DRAFT_652261 [Mycena pura]